MHHFLLKTVPYQLILTEPKGDGPERAVGENIFLDDLISPYKVYIFYYPGAMPNEELEQSLNLEILFVDAHELCYP